MMGRKKERPRFWQPGSSQSGSVLVPPNSSRSVRPPRASQILSASLATVVMRIPRNGSLIIVCHVRQRLVPAAAPLVPQRCFRV